MCWNVSGLVVTGVSCPDSSPSTVPGLVRTSGGCSRRSTNLAIAEGWCGWISAYRLRKAGSRLAAIPPTQLSGASDGRLAVRLKPHGQLAQRFLPVLRARQIQPIVIAQESCIRVRCGNDVQHVNEATVGILALQGLFKPNGEIPLPLAPVRGQEVGGEQDKKGIRPLDRTLDLPDELSAPLPGILPAEDLEPVVLKPPGDQACCFPVLLGVAQKEHVPVPPCVMFQCLSPTPVGSLPPPALPPP
jgi:hypothetical protein